MQSSPDATTWQRMERRLQALEDAEAIRNLKAEYSALCDDHCDANGIAALFTDDAVWENPTLGRYVGREAIRAFLMGAGARVWDVFKKVSPPTTLTPDCMTYHSTGSPFAA